MRFMTTDLASGLARGQTPVENPKARKLGPKQTHPWPTTERRTARATRPPAVRDLARRRPFGRLGAARCFRTCRCGLLGFGQCLMLAHVAAARAGQNCVPATGLPPRPPEINPIVAGWINYYGRFYRSALYPLLARINAYLARWIRRKYKRLARLRKALARLRKAIECM
ncbi:group II intron maturase-specific domain-containing protein [Streptomyces sp. MMS24-I29]|uniref:group II intron maturase-specific domain-containing protein n=1 Tax=Streptomyces sp. MMS24-I29 TaxID=3351480 RepID=UPI003C7CFA04